MAVVNTLSTLVTNADASPRVMNPVIEDGGRERSIFGAVVVAAGDDDTSTFRVCRVKSHWRIKSILKRNDAITGGTDYDVGLYDTAENGGAVVDVNAYADAISLAAADTAGTDVAFDARAIENGGNTVWEDLGLTSDPGLEYDLVFTGVTVGTAAGDITADVTFVEA